LVVGSVLGRGVVAGVIGDHSVDGIVHVAAGKQVEESVHRPLHYHEQDVEGLRVLLEAVTAAGVGSVVFSYSAAVYGAPDLDLVSEDTDCHPVNPYGTTQLIGERMIVDVAAATGLRHVSLRYCEVAGAADGTADEEWSRPVVEPRRAGDSARVVASAALIRDALGWQARYGVDDMVESARAGWTARGARPASSG
jgi:UDP-glucose 4-epimerase